MFGYIICFVLGAMFGFTTMACFAVAGESDRRMEKNKDKNE